MMYAKTSVPRSAKEAPTTNFARLMLPRRSRYARGIVRSGRDGEYCKILA